jgi:hypothetical protein
LAVFIKQAIKKIKNKPENLAAGWFLYAFG